jgi:hypothetical protein
MTPNLNELTCDETSVAAAIGQFVAANKGNFVQVSATICAVARQLRNENIKGYQDAKDFATTEAGKVATLLEQLATKVDNLPKAPTIDTAQILADALKQTQVEIGKISPLLTTEMIGHLNALVAMLDDHEQLKQLGQLVQDLGKLKDRVTDLEAAQKSALKMDDVACLLVGVFQRAADDLAAATSGFNAGTMQCIWGVDYDKGATPNAQAAA